MRTCKVYIITNDVNSKVYIGQTTNSIHERFKQHCNTKYTKLGKAISEIGKEHFHISILKDNIENLDVLVSIEQYYIDKYNSIENGYNSSKATRSQVKSLKDVKKSKLPLTLDSELIKAIKVQAIKENTDVSKILEKLIADYLKSREGK
jgi:group I intron endonuclease